MKINLITEKEITDFEREIGHEIVVNERPHSYNLPRYYAKFENCEVKEDCCLIGTYGNGSTIDEALSNYCNEVSNKRMVFNSHTSKRQEIVFPKLVHTKLLNR